MRVSNVHVVPQVIVSAASLAQSVARRSHNPKVVSSILTRSISYAPEKRHGILTGLGHLQDKRHEQSGAVASVLGS